MSEIIPGSGSDPHIPFVPIEHWLHALDTVNLRLEPYPPLASTGESLERWLHTLDRVKLSLSTYAQRPLPDKPLEEQLFDARAAFKLKTAILAAAHFSRDDRDGLFRQLDNLFDIDNWESMDEVTTEASFTTLLRMMLFLGGRRPGLGVAATGNLIATWTEGDDRLTIECKPGDRVRWVLLQNLNGQQESAAGNTTVARLPAYLSSFKPTRRWFPNVPRQDPE